MKVTKTGKDFERCPDGNHQAVCVDVVDLGLVDYAYQGVPKGKRREVRFIFQVDARDDDDQEVRDEEGNRFLVFAKFTASLSDNAKLLPFLEAWLGVTLPPEVKENGFDMETLVGRNAHIVTVQNEGKDGKKYANIKGIMPIKKSEKKLVPEDFTRTHLREGYEPPFGSDLWEEAQQKAKGGTKAAVPAGNVDEEDDLPF